MAQAQLQRDPSHQPPPGRPAEAAEVDISGVIIEDGAPVDSIYSEKAQRLLTRPLYCCWQPPRTADGAPRPFMATANVGVFISPQIPPLVPDVLLSIGVAVDPSFSHDKRHATYFIWELGKPPDVVIEIVSNRRGDELGRRLRGYARMGVPYYVVWDPRRELRRGELLAFELRGGMFIALDGPPTMPELGLSLAPWEGEFEGVWARWLRWHVDGTPIPTGAERAEAEARRAEAETRRAEAEARRADTEAQRADTEAQRADTEAQRADTEAQRAKAASARAEHLAALLAAHGIDAPEEI